MSTWITRLDGAGTGPRVAVKDLIDVVGLPTTAACPAVAATARPAAADADCLAGFRAVDAAIAGKTNLHELAFGGTGINQWYGTPTNPLDPALIPGGSSSGSAVAVATGEADLALGTDTGGSIRTPSACCGTVGLKTTHGRIATGGVLPLAPSFDTVGPMARDVAGVVLGMTLLDPTFAMTGAEAATTVGRVRIPGTDPAIDAAIDDLLHRAEQTVVEVVLPGFAEAADAGVTLVFVEALRQHGRLAADRPEDVGADIRERFDQARLLSAVAEAEARRVGERWRAELTAAWARTPVLVWPTLLGFPSLLTEPAPDTRTTNVPVNLGGGPALALPVPTGGRLPASLQIVGAHHDEATLCATGLVLEAAGATIS